MTRYYSWGSEFVTATVSVPYYVRTVFRFFTVPFFSLTVRSVKGTEPLIVTVRLIFNINREPYRIKMDLLMSHENGLIPHGSGLTLHEIELLSHEKKISFNEGNFTRKMI